MKDIMVWVAISLLFFQIINHLTRENMEKGIENSKRWQPLLAAVFGIVPGCGATLFLVPLYTKKKLTIGALTASFISTMGDASFIILTQDPLAFLFFSLVSVVIAIIVGYTIDLTPIGKKMQAKIDSSESKSKRDEKNKKAKEKYSEKHIKKDTKKYVPSWFETLDKKIMFPIFWVLILVVFPASISKLFLPNPAFTNYILFIDWLCFVGTVLFFVYYVIKYFVYKKYIKRGDRIHLDDKKSSMIHVLNDSYSNLLFMLTWIFIGTYSYNILEFSVGLENIQWFFALGSGFVALIIAAGIGLIPGCGPQIVFANMFLSGSLGPTDGSFANKSSSYASMTTNSISQDGDAGFPLIATSRKSFLFIKIINLLPALLTGSFILILGMLL